MQFSPQIFIRKEINWCLNIFKERYNLDTNFFSFIHFHTSFSCGDIRVKVYLGLEIPRDFQLFLVYNSCDLAPRRSGVTYRGQRSESHPGKLNVKNGPPLSLSFFGFQKVVFLVINGFSIAIHTDSPSCLKIFCEYWLVGPFRQSFSFLKLAMLVPRRELFPFLALQPFLLLRSSYAALEN